MSPKAEIVFDHDTRKMIYNYIVSYPGVAFTTLKNVYNLSDGTLRYHLEYLEKADQILSGIQNGRRCYYPLRNELSVSKPVENNHRTFTLTNKQMRIINTIKNYPGISQNELIKKTSLSRFTVSYNINKFIDMGLIKRSHNGKNVFYEYMTDDLLRHEVQLRLTMKLLKKEISEEDFLRLSRKLNEK